MFFADCIEELGIVFMKDPEAEVLVVIVNVLQEACEAISFERL